MQEAEEGELLSKRKTHVSIPDLLWVSLAIRGKRRKALEAQFPHLFKKKKKRLLMFPAAAFLKVLRQLIGGLVLAVSELGSKARGRRRQ